MAAATVYNAQRLNALLGQHWKSFAGQPYFDDQGVFISAVVSAPLLITMFVQLVTPLSPAACPLCVHLAAVQTLSIGNSSEILSDPCYSVSLHRAARFEVQVPTAVAASLCKGLSIWGAQEALERTAGAVGDMAADMAASVAQVCYLGQASQLLIDMKRKELRYKARQQARAEKQAANGGDSKKTS